MKTRKSSATRSRKWGDLYEFKSRPTFKQGVLPTTRHVLEILINEPNWRQKTASTTVAEELVNLWSHSNVYSISTAGVISRIENIVKIFCKIDSVSKRRRNGSTFKENVKHFMENVDTLFDIFCKDNSQRRKL